MDEPERTRTTDAALLTAAAVRRLDADAVAAGLSGLVLMERAGGFVAEVVAGRFPAARRVALLAGGGNNGGDAYVAARRLVERGCEASIFALVSPSRLKGDARLAAAAWTGPLADLADFEPDRFDLVVDGLFGVGLSRPVEGAAAEAIRRANESRVPVLAIDLPSGIAGDTGAVLGVAMEAAVTATFVRRKPGHLLLPGRRHCGAVRVGEIGLGDAAVAAVAPATFAAEPALFRHALRLPAADGHKYDRGHAVVFSGPAAKTGAGRLCATAALRAGAGLVTLFSPASAVLVNAAHLTAVMLRRCEDEADLATALEDRRLNAFAIGPGFGDAARARGYVLALLAAGRSVAIDADALTAFAQEPDALFAAIGASEGAAVLTPHAGEFARLFSGIARSGDGKLDMARAAARASGAVVVLKGADTVVAAPDGRAAINATGTPWLATAGSGDVLAGILTAQLAGGMPAFEAAAAAAWMHGRAAELFGPGLTAEDIAPTLPRVLAELTAG